MNEDRFSSRYGVGPQKQQLAQHEVPRWVRGEFEYILHKYSGVRIRLILYEWLRPLIWKITGDRPKDPGHIDYWEIWGRPYVQHVINKCDWWEFFEICEYAHAVIVEYTSRAEEFEIENNKLFAHDLMAWKFEEGKIVPARPDEVAKIFEQAKGLLAETKYAGPNEQFRKANGHLSEKPEPDTENCVKDAVGALEGVANIVTGQPNQTLGGLLSNGYLRPLLPDKLHGVFERLWAYRSSEPGVGHANTGTSTVGVEEAEWVLAMCATSMVFLAKK